MTNMILLLVCLTPWTLLVLADAPADRVETLPGLNFRPNFEHYSGFLQASSKHYFHYWFTKSQSNSTTAPVILWLNGGPGCSSMGGLLEELGPFHVSDNGNTIYENVYAWNKVGNVLFIESPAGVGYSYATDGVLDADDDTVALDNYRALLYFFKWKFPELAGNDFYITGESYAGVYLPTLGSRIGEMFQGMAIGNGLLNIANNYNTMPPLFYYHSLMRHSLFDKVARECCNGNPYTCDYYSFFDDDGPCRAMFLEQLAGARGLDHYNLYNTCYLPQASAANSKRDHIWRHMLRHAGVTSSEIEKMLTIDSANLKENTLPLCAQVNNTEIYMNRDDVRRALHIISVLPHWVDCSDPVGDVYSIVHWDMTEQVNRIANAGIRVLVFNGDVDSVCNGIMNRQFVAALGRDILGDGTEADQPWYYQYETPNVAGHLTRYAGGVDFLTVRGSGHFVPTDRPREALQMLYNWINQRDYSLPTGLDTTPQPLLVN